MGKPQKKWIDTMRMSGKQGEWCMIGVYRGELLGGMHGALPMGGAIDFDKVLQL